MKLAKLNALTKAAVRNMFAEFLSKKTGRLRVGLLVLLAVCFFTDRLSGMAVLRRALPEPCGCGRAAGRAGDGRGRRQPRDFFLSLLMLPGNLYYSNDIKPILAYPVRCAELLSSRFLPALLYEYMFSAFVLIPPL